MLIYELIHGTKNCFHYRRIYVTSRTGIAAYDCICQSTVSHFCHENEEKWIVFASVFIHSFKLVSLLQTLNGMQSR